MNRLIRLGVVCGVILLVSCSASASLDSVLGAEVIPPVFEDVYEQVTAASDIPMLLPTSIPEAALREPEPGQEEPFFTSIITADRDKYEVSLDAIAQCQGAGYCTFGTLEAERLRPDTPTVDEMYAFYLDPNYQPAVRSDELISEVTLANGITGTFIPWVCGANCSTAKVYWEEEGIRYMVGIRSADKATVVAIANSMIENQPQPDMAEVAE